MRNPRHVLAGLVAVQLSVAALAPAAASTPPAPLPAAFVADHNAFAAGLYRQLDQRKGENVFFSPASVSIALGMTHAGARGQTASELAKALHFHLEPSALYPSFGSLQQRLEASGGKNPELHLANQLFAQRDLRLQKPFADVARGAFGADIGLVNYKADPEGARKEINRWVEHKTHDRILDLVPSDAVDTSTRMVLVNAIYFKGTWRSKFEKASTRPEAFHAAPKQALQVSMMHQQQSVPYSETDDAQVVALPYAHADADHALSMVVVLPKDAQGLDTLEAGLSDGSVARFTSALHEQKVVLTLPRWKSTITTPLNAPLQAMGMTTAFSDGADFSGISTDYAMHISAVLHKAFIEVNEEGTEAAAATAVVMMETAAVHEPEQPVRFVADHPFLYFIRDDSTGAVLFMGRVADPTR